MPQLPSIASLEDLARAVVERQRVGTTVYVRFSHGPEDDAEHSSVDHASGLELPGLSVNPLTPPAWWRDHPVQDWVARQLCAYVHLGEQGDGRYPWVLEGREVGRGPDNEPLVVDVAPLGQVSDATVTEAKDLSDAQSSPRPEDAGGTGGAPWQGRG
jgi:hypothetical protein